MNNPAASCGVVHLFSESDFFGIYSYVKSTGYGTEANRATHRANELRKRGG